MTVYEASQDPAVLAAVIARRVRGYRAARGLTLDGLALRAGVSRGMLTQIEQGRTNPSVGTLVRVANALGVGVAQLLEADAPAARVIPAAGAAALWHGAAGSVAELFGGFAAARPGEDLSALWRWALAPGDAYDAEAHQPGTREALYVVAGELTLHVGPADDRVVHRARAGDAVFFPADRPHRYANEAADVLAFVMLVLERTPL